MSKEVYEGRFRRSSFLQLVSDAAEFHCFSATEARALPGCRFAKQSILLSALAIEAAANCVVAEIGLKRLKQKELSNQSTMPKLRQALNLRGKLFDVDREEVKRAAALIQVRNDLAHPKAFKNSVSIEIKHEGERRFLFTELELKDSGPIGIRHKPMGWTCDASLTALQVLNEFCAYLFDTALGYSDRDLALMFGSYIATDMGHVFFDGEQLPNFEEVLSRGVELSAFRRFEAVADSIF